MKINKGRAGEWSILKGWWGGGGGEYEEEDVRGKDDNEEK